MKKRKQTVDSPEEQARAAQGAFRKISPPDYFDLSKEEIIFFDNVIDEMPRADWTGHKIDMAAKIAQYMGVEAELQRAFRSARAKTGSNIMPAQSSAITAAKGVAGIVASYRRSLGLQADGRSVYQANNRKAILKKAERNARRAADEDEDDLIGGDDSGLA